MDARTTTETLLQHGRFVHALARALLRDPAAADDVVQETWMQWWRRADAPTNPRGWLARVVRSLASNQRRATERRARHEAAGAPPEGVRAPDEGAAEAELLHRLVDAVYGLEEPYRETILARYFRGEEAGTLAEASGTPLATVRSRERRALELLRARLDREHGGRAAWAVALARLAPLETAAAGAWLVPWLAAVVLVTAGALGWRLSRPEDPPRKSIVARELTSPIRAAAASARGLEVVSAPDARSQLTPSPAPESGPAAGLSAAGAAPLSLTGNTQDPEGGALAGVRLRFLRGGQEVGETSSDAAGRFEVPGLASFTEVEAELTGYRFLHATDPEPDPLRPFEALRVTLVPAGQLVVSVRDVGGEALAGVGVSVLPRAEELSDTYGSESSLGRLRRTIEVETDATGRAVLPEVWCGVRLTIELDLELGVDSGEVSVERQREGHLVLDGGTGTPIVLTPGRTLELSAQWGALHTLEGVVHDALGAPVADALLVVTDEGYPERATGNMLCRARSGAQGRFELAFRPARMRGPVRVRASVTGDVPHFVGTSDFGGPAAIVHVPELLAELQLTPEGVAVAGSLVLTLAPSELSVLSGVLLDPRGEPLNWRWHQLMLLRAGVAVPRADAVSCLTNGGGFCFSGLPSGAYELLVSRSDALERSRILGEPVFARFAGLAAGAQGLVLRLPDAAPVRLRIRAETLMTGFRLARLLPAGSDRFPRVPAERALTLHETEFWLPGGNGECLERPEGTWVIAGDATYGARDLELPLGEPGWYRIGVTSSAPLAPVATELLWFEAGEYVLDVQPPLATGILRGRLVADGTRDFYGLVLADEHGRPLPIAAPSSGARLDVYPLKASGEFLLRELALGRFRLRVGTCDELAAGRFAREFALEIEPGENVLELRL